MRRRWLLSGLALPLLVSLLTLPGANAAPDPTYPNMPDLGEDVDGANFGYTGSQATTLAYAKKSKQVVQLVDALTVVAVITVPRDPRASGDGPYTEAFCKERLRSRGLDPSRCVVTSTSVTTKNLFTNYAFPATPTDPLTQSTFTDFPPLRVRTAAFGSIPVEATLQLSLPTDAEGLPEPLIVVADNPAYRNDLGDGGPCEACAAETPLVYNELEDAELRGRLDVRVAALTVDGVNVPVGDHCIAPGAKLTGEGKGYYYYYDLTEGTFSYRDLETERPLTDSLVGSDTPSPLDDVPVGHFHPSYGGDLYATLAIPDFRGCVRDSGEDVSRLISTMVSGTQPMRIRLPMITKECWNVDPTQIDLSQCNTAGPLPVPDTESEVLKFLRGQFKP